MSDDAAEVASFVVVAASSAGVEYVVPSSSAEALETFVAKSLKNCCNRWKLYLRKRKAEMF